MHHLELRGVKFAYDNFEEGGKEAKQALFNFDLSLPAGEIAAVTGASGSGKSTLLDLIAGFAWPSEGTIQIAGRDVTTVHPAARGVSILFQNSNLFTHLKVLENVSLALAPKGKPSADQLDQCRNALSKVGLAGYEDRRASELSGGQAQRVALAREMLRDTSLYLLDEPFNGLDDAVLETMLPLVAALTADDKSSVLLVTHDLTSVQSIITSQVEVKDGGCKRS